MRAKLLTVVIATLLLFVSSTLAGSLNFNSSANWKVIASSAGFNYFIKKHPSKNIILTGRSEFDATTGSYIRMCLIGLAGGPYFPVGADFDRSGNIWFACPQGLFRYHEVDSSVIMYTKADGLPSTNCLSVVYDSSNSRLLVATDAGLAIWNIDASGNVTIKSTALSGKNIGQICFYKNQIWAVDNQRNVYHCDVDASWTTSQPNSAGVGVGSLTLDTAGEAYISTASGVRKYNKQTVAWDSVSTTGEVTGWLKIDKDNNLWFVTEKYLGRKNLSTGAVDTIARNGSIAWLGDATNWPILSLTPAGYLLVGGIGAFVEELAPNAIIWSPIQKKVALSYKVIGYVDILGRQIVKKNINSSSPGTYFTVLQASDGTRIIQRGLQIK